MTSRLMVMFFVRLFAGGFVRYGEPRLDKEFRDDKSAIVDGVIMQLHFLISVCYMVQMNH